MRTKVKNNIVEKPRGIHNKCEHFGREKKLSEKMRLVFLVLTLVNFTLCDKVEININPAQDNGEEFCEANSKEEGSNCHFKTGLAKAGKATLEEWFNSAGSFIEEELKAENATSKIDDVAPEGEIGFTS